MRSARHVTPAPPLPPEFLCIYRSRYPFHSMPPVKIILQMASTFLSLPHTAVGDGKSAQANTEQPLHQWTPSIAPSGMVFVTSEKYGKAWEGNLLVGSLKFNYLARLELERPFEGSVVKETRLLESLRERIRDVRQGPDGYIYVVIDSANGQLIRLDPAK
ncbi:MAG: PQQ-dependent sugar dehydrogenase [Dechloromonas sp.]|uniref:PQQ-dependent sugar dehydrogenase n=1 Tax=Candidatus Dechloromonas phosphorivorans TaxID=2899244 RepID=A0A935K8I1_9RHOO|nr:PQQ-dependent sugar dehydrogenase [Candidatus Dechloromonas phosphorivorans]